MTQPLASRPRATTGADSTLRIQNTNTQPASQCLVPLQTAGARTPLFLVHGGSGNATRFPPLAQLLPPGQPFYGLQWDGLDGSTGARTIEAMASRYLRDVRGVQPHGPWLLAGHCIGGLIAREMARQLLAGGEPVALLVMYEAPNLDSPAFHGRRVRPNLWSLLQQRNGRAQRIPLYFRWKLRLGVPPPRRQLHSAMTMVHAIWRYRVPRDVPVRTIYFGTGDPRGESLALSGRWSDGAMGWARHVSPQFELHRIEGDHDAILYAPASVAVLTAALAQFHASCDSQGMKTQ